jgi:predicted RNase H-like HicB family nuclease
VSITSTPSSINSSSTQGSTIAKSRQELMSNIEETIENIFTSISLGEPIKLPFYTRTINQK